MSRQPLSEEQLLQLIENGLSDIECLSDDDDDDEAKYGWEDSFEDNGGDNDDVADESLVPAQEMVEMIPQPGPNASCNTHQSVQEFIKNNDLTTKRNIRWRKGMTYITPNFDWYDNEELEVVELESPYKFFSKYFTNSLLEKMVQFTNLYGQQKNIKFQCTNLEEIKTFIGIHILMGNLHYPRIKCYWETKLRISQISDNMTLNRFYKLRQNLHVVDITRGEENIDRFWKVRPVYDAIRDRLLSLDLENNLSVDEQIVPFKGSLNVKQYVKNKPNPWGIKIFALCGVSGQMFDFLIYQGSTTEIDETKTKVFGQGAAIVLKLCERISKVNCRLYFDNYFSNYNLLQYLRRRHIYATCTARQNRFNNPPFTSDKQMKSQGRGTCEELISEDGEVILTKWFDNRPVVMASNYMGMGNSDLCRRWDKVKKEYVYVNRPEVIRHYNTNMGGVDKLDFLITIHRTFIRSRKWTMRMFTHAIDLACTNAWLEYRRQATALGIPKRNVSDLLHFRAYVADVLTAANKTVTKKRGRPSGKDSPLVPTKKIKWK